MAIGAAKRTLDGEDRFEMIEKVENSATITGAESGPKTGKYRGPFQNRSGIAIAFPSESLSARAGICCKIIPETHRLSFAIGAQL